MSQVSLPVMCVWGKRSGTRNITFTCHLWGRSSGNFDNSRSTSPDCLMQIAWHSFLSLSAQPSGNMCWIQKAWFVAVNWTSHRGPVQLCAALCSTQALSSFQRARTLNYCTKVKAGSPEKALSPESLKGTRGEKWKLAINHGPHGMDLEQLPATSLP